VTVTDRGAVWVKFGEKPSDDIRADLRDAEFRFKRHQLAWVQKATEGNVALAETLWERFQREGGAE
jgi:hypothetical protein